jgi:protein-S-isoprenylcysteine O-methyltransferase Ste14
VALAYGIVCHSLFGVAIAAMIFSIATGLSWGIGPFAGGAAWAANLLLVVQFPLLHSWLLSNRGRAFLTRLAPLGLGRDLATTIYASTGSLQLLATFGLWSPSGTVWWRAEGTAFVLSAVTYAGSWLLLLKAMADAGLDLQSGFRGWGAVVRNRRPQWKPFSTHGLYRFTRQPVYVAFFLTLWTAPVWTPDRLLLAVGWTLYCWIGPLLKERRYLRFESERFRRYQSLVPYWLPSARRFAIPPADLE